MRYLIIFALFCSPIVKAQDDLFSLLEVEDIPQDVTATFKGTRIINGQSVELPAKGNLQFLIEHRFGTINSGAYELWGLDQAQMRMSFDYGLTNNTAIGLARNSFQKTFEASIKSRLVRQKINGGSPISITSYNAVFANSIRWANPERANLFSSRLSYAHQIMIARKFNSSLSLQLTPSLIHRNLVDKKDINNDYVALGIGGRYKLTKRVSLNAEYFYQFKRLNELFENSLSIGFDIETGGHVFQLHVTNSQGMFERAFIGETTGKWSAGDLYFGFNISRVFGLK
jgi:lipopolysaccharide assembly outer membrane protein LptD (OstA)|tara:strand:- start:182 stop:1036 length:855 start_codon:yes stop_codon:yes gene_type:complete